LMPQGVWYQRPQQDGVERARGLRRDMPAETSTVVSTKA
jgi:hypothetical protein